MCIPGPDMVGWVLSGCVLGKRGSKGGAGSPHGAPRLGKAGLRGTEPATPLRPSRPTLSNQRPQRERHLPGPQPQFTPEVYADENRKISVSQIRQGLNRKERRTGQRGRRSRGRRKQTGETRRSVAPTRQRLRGVPDSPARRPRGRVESGDALGRRAGGVAVWQGVRGSRGGRDWGGWRSFLSLVLVRG